MRIPGLRVLSATAARAALIIFIFSVAIGTSAAQAVKVGSNFLIADAPAGFGCSQPSVAGLKNNGFVAAYICSENATQAVITGRLYNGSGTPIRSVLNLPVAIGPEGLYPAVASDDFGKFVIVWDQLRQGAGRDIFARRFDGNGTGTGPVQRVNTTAAGNQNYPSVAYLADGSFVAVWRSRRLGVNRMFGQRFSAAGARIDGEFQANTSTPAGVGPSIAALSPGGFAVVWDSGGQVYGARGARVGDEMRFVHQFGARVVGLKGGGFIVVGYHADPDIISAQRYSRLGARVGDRLAEIAAGTVPAVAALPGGGFVMVWIDELTGDTTAGVYNSLGRLVGGSVQVSDPDKAPLRGPSVAVLSSGGFVVVWSDGDKIWGQRFSAP